MIKELITAILLASIIIQPAYANSRFERTLQRYEARYHIEIIELPQWASRMSDSFVENPNERLLGLTFPDEGKILLFTKDVCEYWRWKAFWHELYHALYMSFDEKEAEAYSAIKMRTSRVKWSQDCHPLPK